MKSFATVMLVLLLAGCTTMTPYERAERIAHDNDVWLVCVANYTHLLMPMKHVNHSHSKTRAPVGEARRLINRRDDIRVNNCRAIYKAAVETE